MSDIPAAKSEAFVSVVSVLDWDEDCVESFLRDCSRTLQEHYTDYEIILIDRGLEEREIAKIDSLLKELPWIRLVKMAGALTKDTAWAAGVEMSIGDFIVLAPVEQDPTEIIPRGVELCRSGKDIVVGIPQNPQRDFYSRFRRFGHRLIGRFIQYPVSAYATEFRVISRRAANAATRSGKHRYRFWVRLCRCGYYGAEMIYERISRTGRLKHKGYLHLVRQGLSLLVFNSMWPLRIAGMLGILGSCGAFLVALYSLVIHIFKQNVVEGWTTSILFLSGMFFLMFLMLGCIMEYLARLFDDRSDQHDYEVMWERHSSVVPQEVRLNVMKESTAKESNAVQTGRDR